MAFPAMLQQERRFAAMGTSAHVLVIGADPDRLVEYAQVRIAELEQRWSRFVPDSEINQLRAGAGSPVHVSQDTVRLVSHGVAAWQQTGGLFDPLMVEQIIAIGYDRSFEDLSGVVGLSETDAGVLPIGGCGDIVVDPSTTTVQLPFGCGFDPGGIGKGLAADIVVQELVDAGACGAMVNLGGDLAVVGESPSGAEWIVSIEEPSIHPESITTVGLIDGGLATSTKAKRRWSTTEGERHHVLDPQTGLPATGSPLLVTTIAGAAWWAEAISTALLVSGATTYRDDSFAAMCLASDGTRERFGNFEGHER